MADILIADDDPILVDILKFRLEGAGHSVFVARDGGMALEAAHEHRPDLIVLDSMMPVMSGPAVLGSLKADRQLKHIPVVMLTARSGDEDIASGLESGAAEYLTKPFIPQELLVCISGLIDAG